MWLKTWNFLNNKYVKWFISIVIIAFIYKQLFYDKNIIILFQPIFEKFNNTFVYICISVVSLSFINWSLESLKWKIALISIEKTNFKTALFSVYSGVATSFFFPNRAGDFIGKLSYISPSRQKYAFVAHLVNGLVQLFITIFFGFLSLILLVFAFNFNSVSLNIILFLGGFIIAFVIMFLFSKKIKNFVLKILQKNPNWFQRINFIKENMHKKHIYWLLLLSVGRYLIFNFQLYLFCSFFAIPIDAKILFLMFFAMYFISTVIPTFVFSEIGARVSVLVWLAMIFFENTDIISNHKEIYLFLLIATTLVWIINVILPSLIGLVIYNLKSKK